MIQGSCYGKNRRNEIKLTKTNKQKQNCHPVILLSVTVVDSSMKKWNQTDKKKNRKEKRTVNQFFNQFFYLFYGKIALLLISYVAKIVVAKSLVAKISVRKMLWRKYQGSLLSQQGSLCMFGPENPLHIQDCAVRKSRDCKSCPCPRGFSVKVDEPEPYILTANKMRWGPLCVTQVIPLGTVNS